MPAEGLRAPRGGSERGKDELTGTVTGPSCTETSRGGALRCFQNRACSRRSVFSVAVLREQPQSVASSGTTVQCTYSVIRNVTQQTEAYVRQARRHTQITFPWVRRSLPMSFCAPPATMHLLVDPTSDERCESKHSVSRAAEARCIGGLLTYFRERAPINHTNSPPGARVLIHGTTAGRARPACTRCPAQPVAFTSTHVRHPQVTMG